MDTKVKDLRRQPGATRISSKNQVTIPVQALAEAGLEAGDVVWAEVVAPGVVQLAVRRLLRLHVHLNFRALLQLGVLLALVYQVRPRCAHGVRTLCYTSMCTAHTPYSTHAAACSALPRHPVD